MSFPPTPRKLHGEQRMNASIAMDRGRLTDVTVLVQAEFSRVLHDRGLQAKEAARELGCSPRAVENWIAGRGGVSVEMLREMARRFPEMRPAIRAFFFLESELDAETERLLATLMAHASRRQT